MDGFRKVPENVPNKDKLSNYLDYPLTSVPDPFNKFDSFGEHNNSKLVEFLDRFKLPFYVPKFYKPIKTDYLMKQ